MTAEELRTKFNNEFGLNKWPDKYEVDYETYANICQEAFNYMIKNHLYVMIPGKGYELTTIKVGQHGGIIFKNVELILK